MRLSERRRHGVHETRNCWACARELGGLGAHLGVHGSLDVEFAGIEVGQEPVQEGDAALERSALCRRNHLHENTNTSV